MSKPVVLVTGSSGNVGKAFVQYLSAKHHDKVTFMFLYSTIVVLTFRSRICIKMLPVVNLDSDPTH